MVNYSLRKNGLFLLIFFRLSCASNDTEKGPSDSFVVSANYGVQSDHIPSNPPQSSDENSRNFPAISYQQYKVYTESSLYGNNKNYDSAYPPSETQEQPNDGHLESPVVAPNQNYLQEYLKKYEVNSAEILPTASEWKAHFGHPPCSQSGSQHFIPHPHYGFQGHPESTTSGQPYQGSYFNKGDLNRNEIIDKPLHTTSFDSYLPTIEHEGQNSLNHGYHQGQDTKNNVIYGSSNKGPHQESQWSVMNEKPLIERAFETTNNRFPSTDGNHKDNDLNDHKPNMMELQEMINKIVKGNSKVHQVLKVPAVYEIHLQEEEHPGGVGSVEHQDNSGFRIPVSQWSAQKWQPGNQMSRPPQRKKRPPGKRPQRVRGGPANTKTWNLPPKIKYFDKRDGLNDDSVPFLGKYAYPKPFSSMEGATDIPLQQWSKGSNNRMYGSVSVPMTPGSTEVTFLDYSGNLRQQNKFNLSLLNSPQSMPDLSQYYAKKKEIENESRGFASGNSDNNAYRRGGYEETWRNSKRNHGRNLRRREENNFFPLGNFNYIIHVREKSRM